LITLSLGLFKNPETFFENFVYILIFLFQNKSDTIKKFRLENTQLNPYIIGLTKNTTMRLLNANI